MFHPTDPTASRLEPLLSARFSMLAPVNIPRYAKYPLGNGQPLHLCEKTSTIQKFCINKQLFPILVEVIQSHPHHFSEGNNLLGGRRLSDASMQSTVSGLIENISLSTINSCKLPDYS